MISDFPVVLDACVLVQADVRDTLLRLFERRLFLARWTDEIIDETVRTIVGATALPLVAGIYGAWDLTLWIIKNRDKA